MNRRILGIINSVWKEIEKNLRKQINMLGETYVLKLKYN